MGSSVYYNFESLFLSEILLITEVLTLLTVCVTVIDSKNKGWLFNFNLGLSRSKNYSNNFFSKKRFMVLTKYCSYRFWKEKT